MTKPNRFRRDAGLTLVEVSIMLTVLVVISAAIVPVLSSVIADTRQTAARADMLSIAQALQQFLEDIGCQIVPQNQGIGSRARRGIVEAPLVAMPDMPPPGTAAARRAMAADEGPCGAAEICTSDPVELLVSSGDIPSLGPDGDSDWVRPPDGDAIDYLEFYLIANRPGNNTDRRFPTPDDCADPLSPLFQEVRAWRGAYLNVGSGDPWGNRYMVNTAFLGPGWVQDVVILSAGPDEEVDSDFDQDGFVQGDDDLAVLISTGS